MGARYVGAVVRRQEDPRYLTGRGRYVDDIQPPGCLHAAVLRSPHAHARVRAVRTAAARACPGVAAVFAAGDLPELKPIPEAGVAPPPLKARVGFQIRSALQYPLARDRVRYVGEPMALVIAESRYAAEDALERITVDYEPLPAISDVEAGLRPDAPRLHPDWPDNLAVSFTAEIGDTDAAFRGAAVVISERIAVQRYAGMPLETRAVLAVPDSRDGSLTVWDSTQLPHLVQKALLETLGLPAHRVRVATPDVGGGFGTKCSIYPEDLLIPVAARRLGRAVKWVETRREHLQSATHSREQRHDVRLAATRDGVILALDDRFLLDQGVFNPWGIVQPYNTVGHMLGPFRVAHARFEARSVVTNKAPHAPYRGAGRPEAVFVMDRMVDRLAREVGLDPAEVRRRNFIQSRDMPYDVGLLYRDGNPLVYDGGDFRATLEAALEAVGYESIRHEQAGLRQRGIHRGVGISSYVEGTGIGPFEGAVVRLDSSGKVIVSTGACSQGQGHETVYAQIVADALGVTPGDVTIVGGDTAAIPFGVGTFASRSMVMAGNAIADASRLVRRKLVDAAAALLEAGAEDLDVEGGRVFVRGSADRGLTFPAIMQAGLPTFAGPGRGGSPAFEATSYASVPTVTFSHAVHVAVADVDPETGAVKLLRYAVAHDCGRVVNPMLVDGQIHGGVAQGIGGGLYEALRYDETGQLLTGTLMEYHVPAADEVPFIDTIHMESESPRNPLGVKGVGEGGAISPPAAIANAVEDALRPFGVKITTAPLTPSLIRSLLAKA
ncbi:MAG TPA: xanthine dehydrogenase family protein molybdopterin-binding subunit [Candidatus Bathyarchaeia archaeon]|nr:xanthine dehydrogenase family protein molybdopterin-binding subunit [Candidatus Bathyarchaeia archaeon]